MLGNFIILLNIMIHSLFTYDFHAKKVTKMFFSHIYKMIVRIDENKAYRHGGLYTSGRGQLITFFLPFKDKH